MIIPTQVLVASVRNIQHVVDAALLGGHICTMPYSVFQQLVKHPLTDTGLKKFLADWEDTESLTCNINRSYAPQDIFDYPDRHESSLLVERRL